MKSEMSGATQNASIEKVSANPFLASLEEFLSTDDLAERLSVSPLFGVDIKQLNVQERLDILDRLQEEYFEPTSTSLDIATRLNRLIRRGYINRDPTKPSVRKITMEMAKYSGSELSKMPWFSTNAKGMTIMGITGLGKSYEVERALQLIPQIIEHGECKAAGWGKMKQVVWIKVGMSHDGSMGGLLIQIIAALDAVLGTMYSQDRSLSRVSNEKLAVLVSIIFRNHGLGVLVIDEIQERNFQGHGRGEFTATFFLRLLNFGIPVVLIGNPLGISALYSFSQDVRRIGSSGTIHLHPLEENDFDWDKCLAPAIASLNLMPEPAQIKDHKRLLFKHSGGIRDFAFRLQIVTQRLALDLNQTFITEELMEQAYWSSDFSDQERAIISGFLEKDPLVLNQFEDIPWEYYAEKWGLFFNGKSFNKITSKHPKETSPHHPDASEKIVPKPEKQVAQSDLEAVKRKRARKSNAANKKAATKNTLNSGDMRADGLKGLLIKGLNLERSQVGK